MFIESSSKFLKIDLKQKIFKNSVLVMQKIKLQGKPFPSPPPFPLRLQPQGKSYMESVGPLLFTYAKGR